MKERLGPILEPYRGRGDRLVPILQMVQAELGYLPDEAMIEIADTTGLPESRVYAVASFYGQFRFTPSGKHKVMVCRGTACHVKGAKRILEETERHLGIKEDETTEDLEYTLETVACIGCCALAPCVMIDDDVEANLTPRKVTEIFEERK
ncbi:formate dehydrogenase, gamma subunit [Candidatus Desulfarcum epimagneticum]|uniref:Formate dehydrogenase, gamma subunit n=1 Tax=uncultured Desulfobacteraceae bacterium TaxID=218296 RepID=A0A484HBZ0_9BACT|nr:formate dehydrogenase, gamma subunit [uncultured Desulfobacteraceae bacterium]